MKPVVAVFALLAALPLAAAAAPSAETYVTLSRSVLRVQAATSDGRVNVGTAVAVAPGQLITNCHVTRGARQIVVSRGSAQFRVEREVADPEHDLCLLHAPGVPATPVTVSSSRGLNIGEEVFAFGYPGGQRLVLSEGSVKALYDMDGGLVIQTDAAFTSGASGGGLFDREGRLVGFTTFHSRGGADIYFAVPVEWGTRLMNETPAAREPLAFWERALEAQPVFLRTAILEAQGQWAEMRGLARDWVRKDDSADAWATLGKAHAGLGMHREAVAAFEQAVVRDPAHALSWLVLWTLHRDLGEAQLAEEARVTYARLAPRGLVH